MNYKDIWIEVNGPIPKDENGISYEIHHIDGDRTNNKLENLECLSIQEHYERHLSQEDYGAAHLIKLRMDNQKSFEELSTLSTLSNKQRLEKGTHNFLLFKKEKPLVDSKRSKAVKKGWKKWKKSNNVLERTSPGTTAGAAKTRGTKWYHKLDGTHLRTLPDDPRIEKEGWIKGRYKGKELSDKANNAKLKRKKNG